MAEAANLSTEISHKNFQVLDSNTNSSVIIFDRSVIIYDRGQNWRLPFNSAPEPIVFRSFSRAFAKFNDLTLPPYSADPMGSDARSCSKSDALHQGCR